MWPLYIFIYIPFAAYSLGQALSKEYAPDYSQLENLKDPYSKSWMFRVEGLGGARAHTPGSRE